MVKTKRGKSILAVAIALVLMLSSLLVMTVSANAASCGVKVVSTSYNKRTCITTVKYRISGKVPAGYNVSIGVSDPETKKGVLGSTKTGTHTVRIKQKLYGKYGCPWAQASIFRGKPYKRLSWDSKKIKL